VDRQFGGKRTERGCAPAPARHAAVGGHGVGHAAPPEAVTHHPLADGVGDEAAPHHHKLLVLRNGRSGPGFDRYSELFSVSVRFFGGGRY